MVPCDVLCRHPNQPKKGLVGCSKHLISIALGGGNSGSMGYKVKHQNDMSKQSIQPEERELHSHSVWVIIQQNSEKVKWILESRMTKKKKTKTNFSPLFLVQVVGNPIILLYKYLSRRAQFQCIYRGKCCYRILMAVTAFLIHLFTLIIHHDPLGALLPSNLCHLQKTRSHDSTIHI